MLAYFQRRRNQSSAGEGSILEKGTLGGTPAPAATLVPAPLLISYFKCKNAVTNLVRTAKNAKILT